MRPLFCILHEGQKVAEDSCKTSSIESAMVYIYLAGYQLFFYTFYESVGKELVKDRFAKVEGG